MHCIGFIWSQCWKSVGVGGSVRLDLYVCPQVPRIRGHVITSISFVYMVLVSDINWSQKAKKKCWLFLGPGKEVSGSVRRDLHSRGDILDINRWSFFSFLAMSHLKELYQINWSSMIEPFRNDEITLRTNCLFEINHSKVWVFSENTRTSFEFHILSKLKSQKNKNSSNLHTENNWNDYCKIYDNPMKVWKGNQSKKFSDCTIQDLTGTE